MGVESRAADREVSVETTPKPTLTAGTATSPYQMEGSGEWMRGIDEE
jgi:hypothetical protein